MNNYTDLNKNIKIWQTKIMTKFKLYLASVTFLFPTNNPWYLHSQDWSLSVYNLAGSGGRCVDCDAQQHHVWPPQVRPPGDRARLWGIRPHLPHGGSRICGALWWRVTHEAQRRPAIVRNLNRLTFLISLFCILPQLLSFLFFQFLFSLFWLTKHVFVPSLFDLMNFSHLHFYHIP